MPSGMITLPLRRPALTPDLSLRASATNPRYFTNGNGEVVFLSGFHTWYDVQDGGSTDPPPVTDWVEFLNALLSYGCNFTKLWTNETSRNWSGTTGNTDWHYPTRYDRTGPGNANDGYLKFNLDRISNHWLDRLYSRAVDCANNGIYVCIQLFQGWQIDDNEGGAANPWDNHPYRLENNVNSVDGDDDNDGNGTETQWTAAAGNNTLAYQQALVLAVLKRLNELDNVLYEISNEPIADISGYNTDWQYDMITYIKAQEANMNKQHPVGMTKQYPNGVDSTLTNSGADWVSYGATTANGTVDGTKVSMYDTDHTVGTTTNFRWAFEALCNGHGGTWYMDQWDGHYYGTDRRNDANYIRVRNNVGYALAMANAADILNMVPTPSLCSTGYCLAKDQASNADYICSNTDALNSFTLDLTNASGTLNLSWRNCNTGETTTDTVSGGAERTLTNPWPANVSAVRVYH